MIVPHLPTHPHGRPHAHADNVVRAHTQSHTHTHMRERERTEKAMSLQRPKSIVLCVILSV